MRLTRLLALLLVLACVSARAEATDSETLNPARSVTRKMIELRAGRQDTMEWILAPGLNAIVPGGGHLVRGRTTEAVALLGGSAALVGGALVAHENDDETLRNNLLVLYQNVGFVSAYEQYVYELSEDARAHGEAPPEGTHWTGLALAPLHGPSLASWEVAVPLVALAGLATWAVLDSEDRDAPPGDEAVGVGALLTGQSAGIGLGEELLFRGLVLPELTAQPGGENRALLAQAAIFGAAHMDPEGDPGDNLAHAAFATTFGLYTGWMSTRRDWGLRKCIALHAWWDTIVFLADYLEDGESEPLYLRMGGSF